MSRAEVARSGSGGSGSADGDSGGRGGGPSHWLGHRPAERTELPERADVIIVGAGYTGLSTAIELRRRGASVVVIEREFAGYGASGRNAGHLTPTIGKDLPSTLRLFGRERGGALIRLADSAVAHVEELIERERIECSYEPVGNLVAGIHRGQAARLEANARAGLELGAEIELLTEAQIRERGVPGAFVCGYLEPRGGVLDPGHYLEGLRRVAVDAGAEIVEGTAVGSIRESGGRVEVSTSRGPVTGSHAVIGTNAWTRELGAPRGGPVPFGVTLAVSRPLDDDQLSRLDWGSRVGVYTAHEILESHRLTSDNRIVSGSRFVRVGRGAELPIGPDAEIEARIERMMCDRFPMLGEVGIDRFWSGPIAFNLNFLPWLGQSEAGGVSWCVGYAGHGIAQATLAGSWLARMATGEPAGPDADALTSVPRIPLPPEPLRHAVAATIIRGLELVDRRTDRRATPEVSA